MNTALKGYLDNGNNSGNDGTGDLVFGLGWIMGICFVSIAYLTTNGSFCNDLCFSMFIMVKYWDQSLPVFWRKYITHCNVVTCNMQRYSLIIYCIFHGCVFLLF